MFSPLHDEVLSMILKNLSKYQIGHDVEIFTGGEGEYTSTPYTPGDDETDNQTSDPIETNNPSKIPGFESYDYHILYNDDEDVIGFTTNNGQITYTLNKDIFEDLITVTIETSALTFKIALIFENYDIRIDGENYVEEKGKLTDVVILDMSNQTPPVKLEINPVSNIIELGKSIQFTAILYYKDGTTQDVTNTAEWSVPFGSTLTNGMFNPSIIGNYTITASSNGMISSSFVIVTNTMIEDAYTIDTTQISMFVRDTQSFDNDTVDLYLNNELKASNIVFTTEGSWIDLDLRTGGNIIRFEAKNSDSGPITGEVTIYKRNRSDSAVVGSSNIFTLMIDLIQEGVQSEPYPYIQYQFNVK